MERTVLKVLVANRKKSSLYSFALFVLGFLLFIEWLRPLHEISQTGSLPLLMMYVAFVFLLSFFGLPFWFTIPLHFIAMLYIIHSAHFSGAILDKSWFYMFAADLIKMFALQGVSDVSRTF